MKKIFVIAAHMDDEVLGCGGAILRHVDQGDLVKVCFVAHRVYDHKFDEQKNEIEESHARDASKLLGYSEIEFLRLNDERLDCCLQDIIIPLEKSIYQFQPDLLYTPFRGDNNQDHRAVFDAMRVVIRPSATPYLKEVLMYETPSSTEQSPPLIENLFAPNFYINISDFIEAKLQALKCYKTEDRPAPHPRSQGGIEVLAKKRGTEIGYLYAEAFMILRKKWS